MKQMKALGFLLTSTMLVLLACQKEIANESKGVAPTQQLSIFLTDDPALFDSVVVDIQSVKVKLDTCSSNDDDDDNNMNHDDDDDSCYVWYTLNIQPGKYDLLRLRNGVDTLLAQGSIPSGEVKKIKIVLGTGHYLVKDGIKYPLNLKPGSSNEIEIKMKHDDWDDHGNGRRKMWIDFDVARSIIKVRDGQFYLLPVLRPFVMKKTGSIKGKVLPKDAMSVLSMYNQTDTAYAIPDKDGEFKIRGLKEGEYTLFVNASNGYRDTTLQNIQIRTEKETKLDTILLKK
jgi:hypothetical protein